MLFQHELVLWNLFLINKRLLCLYKESYHALSFNSDFTVINLFLAWMVLPLLIVIPNQLSTLLISIDDKLKPSIVFTLSTALTNNTN